MACIGSLSLRTKSSVSDWDHTRPAASALEHLHGDSNRIEGCAAACLQVISCSGKLTLVQVEFATATDIDIAE
jgi:hypothetical protein